MRLKEELQAHIYVDDETGKMYIFDGKSLKEIGDVKKPTIGDTPFKSDLDKEDKEREEQIRKEAEEDDTEIESDEEREERIKNIQSKLIDKDIEDEIKYETDQATFIDRKKQKKVKEKKADLARYKGRNVGQIEEFKNDLKNFIAKQVNKEKRTQSYKKPNKNYIGTDLIMPGHRKEKLKKIPKVNFYIDQSSSWSASDIELGKDIASVIAEYDKKGLIDLTFWYFANRIGASPDDNIGGGTGAGALLIDHIKTSGAENVIVMTDDDFDSWNEILSAPDITVPGGVWLLFKGGERSERLIKKIHAKHKKIFDI